MPNQTASITDLFGQNKEAASQQLDQFVSKGMKLLYSDNNLEDVVQTLKSDPNPVTSISRVAVGLVQRLDAAARQAGDEIHDAVKIEGAVDLIHQIADLGVQSGALQKVTPDQIQAAMALAVQDYLKGEIEAGRIDPNELKNEVSKGLQQTPPEQQQALNQEALKINSTVMGDKQQPQQNSGGLLNGISS